MLPGQAEVRDRAVCDQIGRDGGALVGAGRLAVDETVILLHPPLPVVDVAIAMEKERQQNDNLVDG